MDIRDGFVGTVGNTPLIKLRRASEATGCTILGKAEFLNPGGSVKDRAALYIIKDAEERGAAAARAASSSRAPPAIPGSASRWSATRAATAPSSSCPRRRARKRRTCCCCAAPICGSCRRCPTPTRCNYVRYSGRLAEEIAAKEPNGAIWANQFDNLANRRGHYETTGPEIWHQTDGKVDGFTCSVGTGGTLSGVGIALKERNPNIKIYLSDPMGSGIYSWYARREFKPEGNSITEGIGNNRETKNLEGFTPDGQFQITDEEALPILFDLVAGGRAGARRLDRRSTSPARSGSRSELGPGKTIVTILADCGTRYQSKLFNPAFLKERNLPIAEMAGRRQRHDRAGVPRRRLSAVLHGAGDRGRRARHPARPHRVLSDRRRPAGRYRHAAARLRRRRSRSPTRSRATAPTR